MKDSRSHSGPPSERPTPVPWKDAWHIDQCSHLTPGEKLLWRLIRHHEGKDGGAWPRLATLADEAGVRLRTVRRWAHTLQEKGCLEITIRRPHPSLYHSLLPAWVVEGREPATPQSGGGSTSPSSGGSTSPSWGGSYEHDQLNGSPERGSSYTMPTTPGSAGGGETVQPRKEPLRGPGRNNTSQVRTNKGLEVRRLYDQHALHLKVGERTVDFPEWFDGPARRKMTNKDEYVDVYRMLGLPWVFGEVDGVEIRLCAGPFGPFVAQHKAGGRIRSANIPNLDPLRLTLDDALQLLDKKMPVVTSPCWVLDDWDFCVAEDPKPCPECGGERFDPVGIGMEICPTCRPELAHLVEERTGVESVSEGSAQ